MTRQLLVERLDLMQSNVYLLESGGKRMLVDTGGVQTHKKLTAKLTKRGISRGDLSVIALTHAHPDHVGAAKALRDEFGAPIIIHRNEASWLSDGRTQLFEPCGVFGRILDRTLDRTFPEFEPDDVVDHEQRLTDYGFDLEVLHTPGHTPGSVCFLHDEGTVLAGDLLGGGVLRSGRPRGPFFVQDRARLNESVQDVIDRQPRTWQFGHGKAASNTDVRLRWKGM